MMIDGDVQRRASNSFGGPAWFAGLRQQLSNMHRRICANAHCSLEPRALLSAVRSRTGLLLNGNWYCGLSCFAAALPSLVMPQNVVSRQKRASEHRVPLGLLMMSRGELNYGQLQAALDAQRKAARGRLGEWLCEMGYSDERQITVALGIQASCPVLLKAPRAYREWLHLLPLALQVRFLAVPVHFNAASRILSVAFGERVDYTLLYVADRMLDCQTQACLMPRGELLKALEESKAVYRDFEAAFHTEASAQQRVAVVRSYAERLSPLKVDVARCSEYVWVRLRDKQRAFDLLFQDECI
jgi:hypothetical protein